MEPEISKDMSAAEAPSVQPKKNELEDRRKLFLVLALLLLLTATTVAVVIILAQGSRSGGNAGDGGSSSTSTAITSSASETLTTSTITSSTTSAASQLPEGWTYIPPEGCPVKIPIPPKAPPYYLPGTPDVAGGTDETPLYDSLDDKGRFWDTIANGSAEYEDSEYEWVNSWVVLRFAHEEPYNSSLLGTDYNPGYIQISCGVNSTIPARTSEDLFNIDKNLRLVEYSPDWKLNSSSNVNKWGFQTIRAEFEGLLGGYTAYYVATPNQLYQISYDVGSPVANTALDTIINNLQFDTGF